MKLIFQQQSFSFELLRALGYTPYDGADIGECLRTASQIADGDFESWWTQWVATARRVEAIAQRSRAAKHYESARCAFLRASNYYRTAEFFLHANPEDPRILETSGKCSECFEIASRLAGPTWKRVEIPYEDTTLPGYLYTVDDSGRPRPTLIFHGGFDSTVEELYFAGAAAALRRGYNCLTFDGPGQGSVIRVQQRPFRHDWEKVVSPAVDFALSCQGVDGDRLALMGMSQGGYLAPRAAAFEHRLKALVAYDGVFDCFKAMFVVMPPSVTSLLDGPAGPLDEALTNVMTTNAQAAWAVTNGMWTYAVKSPSEFVHAVRPYTLEGVVQNIACPTLVLSAQKDQFFKGQPEELYERLTCKKAFIEFSEDEGAEEHCHAGALTLFHQRTFDWLDEILAPEVSLGPVMTDSANRMERVGRPTVGRDN